MEKISEIFIVATPIGNLNDMTPRGLETLRSCDIIACEDTRQTRKLLTHFEISGKKLTPLHDHIEEAAAHKLIAMLQAEPLHLAVVSDAGTPCISDPGYRLVSMAKSQSIRVTPIPGASALTALVSASGLPSNRVLFLGFLPTKVKALSDEIKTWPAMRASLVFYESPRRILKTFEVIQSHFGDARVCIGRELTKHFEELELMTITEAITWAKEHKALKGELCVMVSLNQDQPTPHHTDHPTELPPEAGTKNLAEFLCKQFGLQKKQAYQLVLESKKNAEKPCP